MELLSLPWGEAEMYWVLTAWGVTKRIVPAMVSPWGVVTVMHRISLSNRSLSRAISLRVCTGLALNLVARFCSKIGQNCSMGASYEMW